MLNLFQTNQEATVGAKGTEETARLTALASTVVTNLFKKFEETNEYEELVKASMSSHEAMDDLLAQTAELDTVDIEFLRQIDEDHLVRMLKSQQSKRSRAKGKVMTMDNYKSMMVGAIAENLIRLVLGRDKAAGYSRVATQASYSEEELEQLAQDQEAVRRAIRNVQSKKSIMKSKANFDPTSDRWQDLLTAEEQLKSIRVAAAPGRTAVVNNKVAELLAQVDDVSNLKAADAKSLLEAVREAIK